MTWATFWLYFGPVALAAAVVGIVLLFVVLVHMERRIEGHR